MSPPIIGKPHLIGNKFYDINGNIIYLRGANYFSNTGDHSKSWLTPTGPTTNSSSDWNTVVVPAIIGTFDKMKSMNLNYFRMHTSAQYWLQDASYISHMPQIAQLAADRGIYLSIDIYSVADVWPLDSTLPFPPYEGTASKVLIPTQQAFVDLWALIANVMKNSPNVILGEIQNEPCGTYQDNTNNWRMVDLPLFLTICQQVITRIRSITDLPIMLQWSYGISGSMNSARTQLNLWAPNVTMDVYADDPKVQGTNIIYSTHLYEGQQLESNMAWITDSPSLAKYLTLSRIEDVASRKVVLIAELGGLRSSAPDGPASQTWMTNMMDLLYARGIGWSNWVWFCPFNSNHGDEIVALGAVNYTPLTDKGLIIAQKTASMPNPPSGPQHMLTIMSNPSGLPFTLRKVA